MFHDSQPSHTPRDLPAELIYQDRNFAVDFRYRLRLTRDIFSAGNPLLARLLTESIQSDRDVGAAVIIDQGVAAAWPQMADAVCEKLSRQSNLRFTPEDILVVPGGEQAKNDSHVLHQILDRIHDSQLCRHSSVFAIGGGAVLDVAGYAAAIAHRGVRLIRFPTTTLAQGDAGIGVKNGINFYGKKNFLGTFAAPWAVINDASFLKTLSGRDWRCGLSEAVKVALVKDASFFSHIESHVTQLGSRDESLIEPIIRRSAELHLDHIVCSGDPFELTTARPLDFGHWAAHKLEEMTDFELRHGEAVAIGIAIDVSYSALIGLLSQTDVERIVRCLLALGLPINHAAMQQSDTLLQGLEEFREHLGGRLTIALLAGIGEQVDVHDVDRNMMIDAIGRLADFG